jgi:N-acetyl-anhydromuramyl-L-alanine amidase AmpD
MKGMTFKPLHPEVIVVHSAATKADMDIDAAWINEEHLKRGFFEIGYHYFIKRDGTIEEGRNINRWGAHCRGHNGYTIGICYAGGLSARGKAEDNKTAEQEVSLAVLIAELLQRFPKITDVYGHRDMKGASTECPSFEVSEWLKKYSTIGGLLEHNRRAL